MPMNESDKIGHLLRRAGFAARPGEIDARVSKGLAATVDELVNFEAVSDNLAALPMAPNGSDYLKLSEGEFHDIAYKFVRDLTLWWVNAMIATTRPLQEKMVLFWHGLFATSLDNVYDTRQMYLQNENFRGNFSPSTGQVARPNLSSPFPVGNFRDILEYLSSDPAMLFWLDNWQNHKFSTDVGSNENYARELLELFSMGVMDPVTGEPNYTEPDVRQASRALTGWTVYPPGKDGPATFPRRFFFDGRDGVHDYGPYRILGVRFGGDGRRLFDTIVAHKNPGQQQSSVGRFLGYRLFRFFGYDNPEPEIINALASVFDGSGGQPPFIIRNMLRTMFTPGNIVSEAFYSDRAFKAHVKSPTEYIVGTFRLLKPEGLPNTEDAKYALIFSLRKMGQELFRPPNVSGWKEGADWINTAFHLSRLNFALSTATERRPTRGSIDVGQILQQNNLQTPEQIVDYFTRLMLSSPISPTLRQLLANYLRAPSENPDERDFVNMKVRGLIYLIMGLPEFHLS
jgi:uncharacterized protein (DUF1800 family)